MAITTRFATNTALQYNEVDVTDYLIDVSNGSRRFLTESEQTRLLRATETSALYFLANTSIVGGAARYRWYDSGGTLLNEYNLSLASVGTHNSIPIDWSSFYVPEAAVKMTVSIVSTGNGFANSSFEQGSGNLFTSWTLNQPSRTNRVIRSQEFDNASWVKTSGGTGSAPVVTANNVIAPDGTLTADRIVFNTGAGTTSTAESSLEQQNISVTNATVYAASVWLRGAVGGEQVLLRHATGGGSAYELLTLTTEWQRFHTLRTTTSTSVNFIIAVRQGIFGRINSNPTIYAWGAQLELARVTPYIPTTSATVTTSLGSIIQDATGGLGGSRCLKMWASTGGTNLTQSVSVVDGVQYTVSFWARVDELYGNDYLTGPADASLLLSTEWTYYSQIPFTQVGSGPEVMFFDYTNDENYGFVYLDNISIVASTPEPSMLSEEQTYLLDESCVAYEYQLNWLNKLGGRDTWVMTGFPSEVVDVKRSNEIEYSKRTNYTSPNRIYGFRENQSRKTITLTHQCKTRTTAEWLKSELIDSIDVMLLIDGVYYPCDVVPNSIVVRNTFSQDYTVRVSLRYAYDINVQTR